MSEKARVGQELEFAHDLIKPVLDEMRQGDCVSQLHVCRGNFTRDEAALLTGDYSQMSDFFESVNADMLTLEFSTPRAGELEALFQNPRLAEQIRLGLGVVNPRIDYVETPEEIIAAVEKAMEYLPAERIWLNPDCGFATFANRPMNGMDIIDKKMRAMVETSHRLQDKYA